MLEDVEPSADLRVMPIREYNINNPQKVEIKDGPFLTVLPFRIVLGIQWLNGVLLYSNLKHQFPLPRKQVPKQKRSIQHFDRYYTNIQQSDIFPIFLFF